MKSRTLRLAVLVAAAAAPLLAGCASGDPYAAPQAAPVRTTRSPVVAPSGPASPWWWPLWESWWPGGQ
jgi:type IV pilus biogenesis protein CpaD/CtpE